MPDSLILDETIELLGGRAVSAVPECQGATFMLGPGWSEGAPQPEIDITETLALDGEIPIGDRMGNRTVSLPVVIQAPTRSALAAAREYLLRTVTKRSFTLRWTREGSTLPLLFDCFKAAASTVTQSLPVERGALASQVTVTFPAKPYGRSDTPQVLDFQSPLATRPVPPVPVTVDNFSSVSGTQWAANPQSPVYGGQSAFWDPTINPANNPAGIGQKAVYSKSGLALDLAAGWTAVSQNNSGFSNLIVLPTSQAAALKVGDTFQLAANFLTGDATNFDGGTLANWAPVPSTGNCSLTNTTAQAHSGTHSMQMSSTAAGDMNAEHTITPLTQAMACIAGDVCWASAWFRTQTSARTCLVGISFFDAVGNFLYTGFGLQSGITDSTSAWTNTTTSFGVIAPTGAAWAVAVAKVQATGGAAEVHYVDDVILSGRGAAPSQTTIFTVNTIGPPASGFVNVTFSPNAAATIQSGQVIIKVGPPQLSALTLWAGFGSTLFFHHFSRLGGRVTFAFTLTDTYGTVISFSKTVQIYGSNDNTNPKWEKIKIPIPFSALFDYHNVAAYSLTVTNRTIGLHYSQLYISALTAVPPPLPLVSPSRGVLYELSGLVGSARAPCAMQFQQSGSNTYTKILNIGGTGQWLCPPGVSSVNVFAIGGGGAASYFNTVGTGGGGGAGSAANAAVAVTAGTYYAYVVGTGGVQPPGGPPPTFIGVATNPTDSKFTGDSVTVQAHAGGMAPGGTAGGAAGAAGTGGFAGGAGGAGVNSSTGGGGGGGASGGTAANGSAGAAGSGTTGGLGGAAVAGGGPGGNGGTHNIGNGRTPLSGYGGGGGGSPAGAFGTVGHGYGGVIQLIYTSTTPLFQTLLVHRPRKDAPVNLVPFVSPDPGDVPNNGIGYIVGTLVPGVQPKFDGTYTVVVVAYSWASPANPSTITVTVSQNEASGTSYATNVSTTVTPNNLPATSGTNAGHGPFVVVGEITLPLNEVPPDNQNSWYSVSILSSNTGDRFMDILFLDTQGSTIAIESPTAYFNYFLDSPTDTRDIGYVLGSLYDRPDAISVLDRVAFLSGGPMSVDPFGSPHVLVYAAEGAPNMQLVYYPVWLQDRQQ